MTFTCLVNVTVMRLVVAGFHGNNMTVKWATYPEIYHEKLQLEDSFQYLTAEKEK